MKLKYRIPYYFHVFGQKIKKSVGLISKEKYKIRKIRYKNKYYKNNDENYKEYLNYLLNENANRKPETFVEIDKDDYVRTEDTPKLIAWYLPQYHQMEVNNKFHGQGFTEWSNVTRAIPAFKGHYQPHIPYDVGFYDLMNPATLERQIALARKYGIYGFAFHWYWFSGQRTMEKPLEMFLKHPEYNIKFCINWANENWSTLWDGGNKELIFEQKLRDGDAQKFFSDVLPYFTDDRYIKIKGCPLLSVYRPSVFGKEYFKKLCDDLRECARAAGFPGLYILVTNAFDFDENPEEWGADALVEFPPFGIKAKRLVLNRFVNPHFKATVLDLDSVCQERRYLYPHNAKVFYRSALVGFDNTARKGFSSGAVYFGASPKNFRQWLEDLIVESRCIHTKDQNFIFINSWNEWGEGSHLEPDYKFGYSYLKEVRNALENSSLLINDVFIENECKGKENPIFVVNCVESLGDIIACEPIARYLKNKYKGSKIFWVIRKDYVDAVKFNPYIDKIIEVSSLYEADRVCQSYNPESHVLVDTHFNNRISDKQGHLHKNLINPCIHERNYFNFGGILSVFSLISGLPKLTMPPKFWLDKDAELSVKNKVTNLDGKYVVIHTRSAEDIKEWPINKWKTVVKYLIDRGYRVIELGQENTIKINDPMFICAHDRDCSLQENAWIARNASLFVGIDSCFAHVANCFNIPSIVLLGTYKAFSFYTPFSNVRENRKELRKYSINSIGEQEVIELIGKMLETPDK